MAMAMANANNGSLVVDVSRARSLEPECQYPLLPTGCEATALSFMLRWILWGRGADAAPSKDAVARRLIKEPLPYKPTEGAESLIGGDPHRAFVGDPFTEESFGVFHEPIASLLRVYLEEFRHGEETNPSLPNEVKEMSGCAFDDLLTQLRNGFPVIVWVTLDLREPKLTDRWLDYKDNTREITWTSPEHCLLLVGFDHSLASNHRVIVLDPHTGRRDQHDQELFRLRWEQLGSQAVSVC
eukprot:TRINITY_DN4057_c0_g1_i2.p1 TRINITY_DN4057_c0_g1~~TRINITY_DN4057_c0_g1_i2.p1  ORF type:complete len:240 (+),score=48.30 TRINITY_DN4057_c0_g1_i2:51-770(+)